MDNVKEKINIINKFILLENLFNEIKSWYENKMNIDINDILKKHNYICNYKEKVNITMLDNVIKIKIPIEDYEYIDLDKLKYEICKIIYNEKNKIN
jgi:hypothetical protein